MFGWSENVGKIVTLCLVIHGPKEENFNKLKKKKIIFSATKQRLSFFFFQEKFVTSLFLVEYKINRLDSAENG